ncbi:MAG: hypothetical protein ACK417_01625 [Bacteroidia bacterium]
MNHKILIVLALGLALAACKKDDINPLPEQPQQPTVSLRNKLMANDWQLIGWKAVEASDSTQQIDFYEFFVEDCSKDDRFRFLPGDSLRISEHLILCEGSSELFYAGWQLIDSSSNLKLMFGWEQINGTARLLGDTAFSLSFSEQWMGQNYHQIMTYHKR